MKNRYVQFFVVAIAGGVILYLVDSAIGVDLLNLPLWARFTHVAAYMGYGIVVWEIAKNIGSKS